MAYSFEEKLKSGLGTTNRSNKVNVGAHSQGIEIIDINQPRSGLPVLGRNQRYEIVEAQIKSSKIKFGIDVSTGAFDTDGATISITFGPNTTPQVIAVASGAGLDSKNFSSGAQARVTFAAENKSTYHNKTLVIVDHAGRSVTFTCNKFTHATSGSGTAYEVSARTADTTGRIQAIKMRAAINLARENGDLDVTVLSQSETEALGFTRNDVIITQGSAGASGNTTISGTGIGTVHTVVQFSGGAENQASLFMGNGSFTSPTSSQLDFPSRILPILNSNPNYIAYFDGFEANVARFRIEAIHTVDNKFDLSITSNNANVRTVLDRAENQSGSNKFHDVSKNNYFTDLDGVYDSSHHDNPTLVGYSAHVGLEGNFATASRPFAFASGSDAGVDTDDVSFLAADVQAEVTMRAIETDPQKLFGRTLILTDARNASDGRGGPKTVAFTYEDVAAPVKPGELIPGPFDSIHLYLVGASSISNVEQHATALEAAFALAKTNGDLRISAVRTSNILKLTQDDAGPAGNTEIAGSAVTGSFAVTLDTNFSFTGGRLASADESHYEGRLGGNQLGGQKTARLISMPNDRVRQKISFKLETADYGFGKEYKETTPFFDLGAYNAVSYVNESGPPGMFPIVGSFASYDSALQLNGIIEPFEIRRKIIGNSILLPNEGPINGELATKNPNAMAADHWFDSRTLNKRTEFYEDVTTRGFSPGSLYLDPLQSATRLRINDKVYVISEDRDGVVTNIIDSSTVEVQLSGDPNTIETTGGNLSLPRFAGTSDPEAHAAACLEGEYVSDFTQNVFPWEDREQKDFILNVDSGILSVLQSMNPSGSDGVLPLYASDMATGFDSFSRDRQNSITYRGLLRS